MVWGLPRPPNYIPLGNCFFVHIKPKRIFKSNMFIKVLNMFIKFLRGV